jgi:hypothetical protein
MKDLQKLFEGLADGLKSLSKGIDDLAGKLDALVQAQAATKKKAAKPAKPKKAAKPVKAKKAAKPAKAKKAAKPAKAKKAAPKPKKKTVTAADTVFAIISRAKKGVNIEGIKKKTDFNDKKIHNIIYKLKKQEKIQSISKGIYAKK